MVVDDGPWRDLVEHAGFVPAGGPGAGATSPVGYTVEFTNVDGNFCRLAQVDLGTGVVTPIGGWLDATSVYACSFDLAFSPDGMLYGIADVVLTKSDVEATDVDGAHLVRSDTATGAVTDLGAISGDPLALPGAHGITFDAGGRLFVYAEIGQESGNEAAVPCGVGRACLFEVDPANPGAAVQIGSGPDSGEASVQGLAARCAGDVWGLGTDDPADQGVGAHVIGEGKVFVIGPDTGSAVAGAALAVADEDAATRVVGLAIAPLSCGSPEPEPESAPAAVALEPTFTG